MLAITWLTPAPLQAQEDTQRGSLDVTVKRIPQNDNSLFKVNASVFVPNTAQQVWQVLTAYERLADFVPNLTSSKVVSRNGNEIIVEQNGKAGFLFMKRNIQLVARVIEQPFSAIDLALVKGDMKQYAARWELTPSVQDGISGTMISYAATMEPDFFVPPIMSSRLVQDDVKKTMQGVIAEIGKR